MANVHLVVKSFCINKKTLQKKAHQAEHLDRQAFVRTLSLKDNAHYSTIYSVDPTRVGQNKLKP
jgi:hypothetical protein